MHITVVSVCPSVTIFDDMVPTGYLPYEIIIKKKTEQVLFS